MEPPKRNKKKAKAAAAATAAAVPFDSDAARAARAARFAASSAIPVEPVSEPRRAHPQSGRVVISDTRTALVALCTRKFVRAQGLSDTTEWLTDELRAQMDAQGITAEEIVDAASREDGAPTAPALYAEAGKRPRSLSVEKLTKARAAAGAAARKKRKSIPTA